MWGTDRRLRRRFRLRNPTLQASVFGRVLVGRRAKRRDASEDFAPDPVAFPIGSRQHGIDPHRGLDRSIITVLFSHLVSAGPHFPISHARPGALPAERGQADALSNLVARARFRLAGSSPARAVDTCTAAAFGDLFVAVAQLGAASVGSPS